MADPKLELLLGRVAVHLKMITMDQLAEATRLQGPEGEQRIGDILVQNGWMTEEQLEQAVKFQKEYIARRQQAAAAPSAAASPAAEAGATVKAAPAAAHKPKPAPHGAKPGADKPAAGHAPKSVSHGGAEPAAASARHHAAERPGGRTNPLKAADRLVALLTRAVNLKASDLHLHSGAPIKLRVHGEFVDEGDALLAADQAERMVISSMTPEQREAFEKQGELDFAYTLPGVARFRANAYRQHRGVDAVFRVIPPAPPTLGELGLPESLAKVVNFHQGLVLLTGPAGCGKSSTMAALINILNEERRDHILTIEDPIEHLHASKRCVVNQRQVSRHTESYARALRAALREDPDVIVIGELRDRESISLALSAAETGHLVLGTLHTNSAIRTIHRILGVFPPSQQAQIKTMISESLKAIVSQRLLPAADKSRRVAALEILMCNRAVGNLIREGKTVQIHSTLQTGAPHGMCLMDASLAALLKAGTITKDEALRHCDDPKRLAA